MSASTAIGMVSASLRNLLFHEMKLAPAVDVTVLAPDELITGFVVPAGPWTRRSLYVKVRDRESYAYGVATAAVALDLRGGVVRDVRIGLGAVSYKPWRAHEAEALEVLGSVLGAGAALRTARHEQALAQVVLQGRQRDAALRRELRDPHRFLLDIG